MWLILGAAVAAFIFFKFDKIGAVERDNKYHSTGKSSHNAEKIDHQPDGQSSTDQVFLSLLNLHPEGELINFERSLTFNYIDSYKRKSTRTVKFEKAFSAEKTYIYGFCELRSEHRMFKISGMSQICDEKTKRLLSRIELEQLVLDSLHIIY